MNGNSMMEERHDEHGSAIIFVLVAILLASVVSVAFLGQASTDILQTRRYTQYKQAMGVAEAGMDRAVLELKNAVFKYGVPQQEHLGQIGRPTISGFSFEAPCGADAYSVLPDGQYHHQALIDAGRWTGMYGDYQRYDIQVGVTHDETNRGVALVQRMQTLVIPVFQFGVFYEEDLEIFPGPEMIFEGPVHTNEDLYVGCNNSLKFDEKVTSHDKIYGDRKDEPGKVEDGIVRIKDSTGNYVPMRDNKSETPMDHNDPQWAVKSVQMWDGRFIDSAHSVPEMKLPIPLGNDPHDIIERADPDNDPAKLLSEKFETKAGIIIWLDENGEAHGKTGDGGEFRLSGRHPASVAGKLKFREEQDFEIVTADGDVITPENLQEWEGEATSVRLVTRNTQNNFDVDGNEEFEIPSDTPVELETQGSMSVRVFKNDNDRWFVKWTEPEHADLKVDSLPTGGSEIPPIVDTSEFADWREGGGQPKTMRSLDIDVAALANHDYYPADGAVVYIYNEQAEDGETPVVRLKNGAELPNRITFATPDPIYIWGDYNNTGYTQPSLVVGDAVHILSNAWKDENSWEGGKNDPDSTWNDDKKASYTEVYTVLMTGNTDTDVGDYNGGLENVLRFLEKWKNVELKFRGSIVCMWNSEIATGKWVYGRPRYEAPKRNWGYDTMYRNPYNSPPGIPCVTALEALSWRQATWDDLQLPEVLAKQ